MQSEIVHVCSKCKTAYTSAQWDKLPPAAGGAESLMCDGLLMEWRNCPCGGTMGHDVIPAVLSLLFA